MPEIVPPGVVTFPFGTVEVVPTLISEPVMYRILVGPEHKDDIINTIADLMELGISDYFLTHG